MSLNRRILSTATELLIRQRFIEEYA